MAKKRPARKAARTTKRTAPRRATPKKRPVIKKRMAVKKPVLRKTSTRIVTKPSKTAPMQVMEVTHLPDAAVGTAATAPEKGAPLMVENAHQHVTIEHAPDMHHAHAAAPATLKRTLIVRVRDWFSAVPNVEVVLTRDVAVMSRQKTDLNGEVRFSDLEQGEYQYEVVFRGDIKRTVILTRDRSVTARFW